MKNTIKILFSIALLFNVAACDVIEGPYMESGSSGGNDGDDFQKVVLLEEFTGHHCSNCPAASLIATQLHSLYGDRLVIIAYHADWFARPTTTHPVDYTTEVGESLYDYFSITSNPSGVINRISGDNGYVFPSVDWGTAIAQQMELEPTVGLNVDVTYSSSTRSVVVDVETVALVDLANPVWICTYITEDGLISAQSTVDLTNYPDGIIQNYEHNHVFRQSLNGEWGSVVAESMTNGQSVNKQINGVLGQDLVADNCKAITIAYDKTTGEVLYAVASDL